MKTQTFTFLIFWLSALLLTAPAPLCHAAEPEANRLGLFLTGLSGSHQFKVYFLRACSLLRKSMLANGYAPEDLVRFSESGKDPLTWGRHEQATAENIETWMQTASQREKPWDDAFIFIAGHANGRDEKALLHLPEKDLTYETLIQWIDRLPARRIILVLAAPQGHVWIEKLSRENRVLIVGNGLREFDFIPMIFLHLFPTAFVHSFGNVHDGETSAVSLRDIFEETQKRVQNWYRINHLHPTELALVDADGNGKGESMFLSEQTVPAPANVPAQPSPVPVENGPPQPLTYELKIADQVLKLKLFPGKNGTLEPMMDDSLPEARITQKIFFKFPGGNQHGT